MHKYHVSQLTGGTKDLLCIEAKSFINEHCSQKSMEIYKMIIMMSEDKKNNIMPMFQKNPENNWYIFTAASNQDETISGVIKFNENAHKIWKQKGTNRVPAVDGTIIWNTTKP